MGVVCPSGRPQYVAGGVVGLVACVVLTAALALFVRNKRRTSKLS